MDTPMENYISNSQKWLPGLASVLGDSRPFSPLLGWVIESISSELTPLYILITYANRCWYLYFRINFWAMILELLAELYLCVILRMKDYGFLEVSMKLKTI